MRIVMLLNLVTTVARQFPAHANLYFDRQGIITGCTLLCFSVMYSCCHIYHFVIIGLPEIEVWKEEVDTADLDSIFVLERGNVILPALRNAPRYIQFCFGLSIFLLSFKRNIIIIPDTALALLLRFLGIFFIVLSRLCPQLLELSQSFPNTLH